MANTASARKRIRQNVVRAARNQARKSRMRTFIKKVEMAIAGGDKVAASAALRAAQPEMRRAATPGSMAGRFAPGNCQRLARLCARFLRECEPSANIEDANQFFKQQLRAGSARSMFQPETERGLGSRQRVAAFRLPRNS